MLCMLSEGYPTLHIGPPHFTIGLVVLPDGKPFELNAVRTHTTLYQGLDPVKQYLWSPDNPARFNERAKLIPGGQKPTGVDFVIAQMEAADEMGLTM